MIASVRNQLERLIPVRETVILSPMSEDELKALEAAVGIPLPACLREYYRIVGLLQDLTSYSDESEFELHESAAQVVEGRRAITTLFGAKADGLFPFADSGAGDPIAVGEGADCSQLYFLDHETRKIRKLGSFCEWLEKVVDRALKSRRAPNSLKRHYFQFSFRGKTPDGVLEVLRRIAPASLGPWSDTVKSQSGVESSRAPLEFGGHQYLLKKLEYWTWESPMYSLDYNEPPHVPVAESLFRKLDDAFRNAEVGYKLVDYGVLNSAEIEKYEAEEKARGTMTAGKPGRKWWLWW